MSFGSTIAKTVDEIKKIEDKTWCYDERVYDKVPTKYILSLYRRCCIHTSALAWDNNIKAEINYLLNARDRLKKILDKRENIK